MGNTPSQGPRSDKRTSVATSSATQKLDEKECVFIAMQGDIDRAIDQNNQETMKALAGEVVANLYDLQQLRTTKLTSTERGRLQKVTHNFELSLAKLKSIYVGSTAARKKSRGELRPAPAPPNPDLVSDLITDSHSAAASRSNSLYGRQLSTSEDALQSVEAHLSALKAQATLPTSDITQYYQMDKDIFYLYIQLKQLKVPDDSQLNDQKFSLLKQLHELRQYVDEKAGELEEQRECREDITALEMLLDSAAESDMINLVAQAVKLYDKVRDSPWEQDKADLLQRIGRFLEKVAPGAQDPVEAEPNYDNVERLREVSRRVQRSGSSASQRSTVYQNADLISLSGSLAAADRRRIDEATKSKRPLPLPRNYDDKIVNDLVKSWQKLKDIDEKPVLSDTDLVELVEIQRNAEIARGLFERKIGKIRERVEETVEL